jgi:hypothetical protein
MPSVTMPSVVVLNVVAPNNKAIIIILKDKMFKISNLKVCLRKNAGNEFKQIEEDSKTYFCGLFKP